MATPIRRKPVPSTSSLTLSPSDGQEAALDFHSLLPESQPSVLKATSSDSCSRDEHDRLDAANPSVDSMKPGSLVPTFRDHQPSTTELPHKDSYTWRPFILRRRILIACIIIFVALFSALEALYQVSQTRQGIATTNSSKYYIWTYTPTAIFTLLAAFWSRIDYRAKQMSPWTQMASRFSPASRTLLLNYWSYLLPTTVVFKAIKHQDFLVALSATGSLVFKIIIILSTGLLTLDNLAVERTNVPLVTSTVFGNSNAALNDSGTLPFTLYGGVQYANLSYPAGTNEQFAFQSFASTTNQNESLLTAEVDAFFVDLECDVAQMNFGSWVQAQSYHADREVSDGIDISISSPSCSLNFSQDIGPYCMVPTVPVNIDAKGAIWSVGVYNLCQCANSQELRILLFVGAALQENTTGSTDDVTYTTLNLVNSTQFMCSPTYGINRAVVTINGAGQLPATVELLPNSPNRTLAGVTGLDLANTFYSISPTNAYQGLGLYGDLLQNPFDGLLQYAVSQAGNPSLADLMSPDKLVNVSKSLFRAVTAQVAKISLLEEANQSITGTSWNFEDRLILRVVSVRTIEALLLLLLFFAVAMIFLIPGKGMLPLDPDSIGGLAALITKSSDLKRALSGMGWSSLSSISTRLSSNDYHTAVASNRSQYSFQVQTSESPLQDLTTMREAESLPSQTSAIMWWRPFGATVYAQLLAISSVITAVIALELLLRTSQRHTGFADVSRTGFAHYASTYIPALAMVSIGLMFGALDDSTKVFAPYAKLKNGAASSRHLFINHLRYTTIENIWLSVKGRNFAVFSSSTASFLGSFLTIVVSGVFVINAVPSSQMAELSMKTWFTNNNASFNINADAATLASLVVVANLTYPAWTYDELAFAILELKTPNTTIQSPGTISATIPAVRSRLNCTLLVGDSVESTMEGCPDPGQVCDQGILHITTHPPPNTSKGYTCYPMSLSVGSGTPNLIFAYDDGSNLAGSCHTWAWGNINSTSVENLVALSCYEDVEYLMVNTTLLIPSLAIDGANPPVPDESTAQALTPNIADYTAYLPSITGSWTNKTNYYFNPFFSLLMDTDEALQLDFFSDPKLSNNISDAIQHLHKVLSAQIYGSANSSLRINTTEGAPQTIFAGTAVYPNRERLIQNAVSTRVLQALLATMGICILVQCLFIRTKEVLPKDPRSVAALASLLVDSEMLELVKELDGNRSTIGEGFEGHTFGMGWFEGSRIDGRGVREGLITKEPGFRKRRFAIDLTS